MKGTTSGTNPAPLFEDRPGPGLEPVGGEFQPSFETGYAGGGALLISVLHSICALNDNIHISKVKLLADLSTCDL
jgi:hypothetical protein